MNNTIAIYLNNKASGSNLKKEIKEIKRALFRYDLKFREPDSLDSLKKSITEDIKNGIKNFFSVGGDGTFNKILQTAHAEDTKLFIIPTGTANDLASNLGISNGLKEVPQIFKKNYLATMDIIKVNDSMMATNGGIGIVSEISDVVNDLRDNIPGFKTLMKHVQAEVYNITLAGKIFTSAINYHRLHIESPDFPRLDTIIETPLLLINNQKAIGKKFIVAPNTKNNDGKFNVTILTHRDKTRLISALIKMRMGKDFSKDEDIISFETDQINIMNLKKGPIKFFGDGEYLSEDNHFNISISNIKQNIGYMPESKNRIQPASYALDEIEMV